MKPSGKCWRVAYCHVGKQKELALGVHPAVSLAKARKGRDMAREQLGEGTGPGTAKWAENQARAAAAANTFELVARQHGSRPRAVSPNGCVLACA